MNNESENLAETDNFIVWTSDESGETAYHVELGGISLHLTSEEWEELVTLIQDANQVK